jgi:hypothetical protein
MHGIDSTLFNPIKKGFTLTNNHVRFTLFFSTHAELQ